MPSKPNPAVSLEDVAGHLAILEERQEQIQATQSRIERKLDALLKALGDGEEDAEDARLIREAWDQQGDRPLIPLADVKRQLGL
jgi:hypothetical protein